MSEKKSSIWVVAGAAALLVTLASCSSKSIPTPSAAASSPVVSAAVSPSSAEVSPSAQPSVSIPASPAAVSPVASSAAASSAKSAVTPSQAAAASSARAKVTPSPAASHSQPAGGTTKLTPPGTKLKIGQQAALPYVGLDNNGTMGVSVTSVVKGTPADLTPLKLGAQAAGFTPYYINFKVINLSGTNLAFTSLPDAEGLLPDGTTAQPVSILGSFAKCPSTQAGADFKTKGASYTTCILALAGTGTKVVGASYLGDDDGALDKPYGMNPVTWH